jgi:predicted DNA-binding protein (UPF0278 family)
MKKDKAYFEDIRDKILKGMQLAAEKLIREKAKENGELILFRHGKIENVKAKDLLKNQSE